MSSSYNTILIILGYPATDNGKPGAILLSRLKKGIEEYKQGKAAKIIVTGGAISNEYVEAEVMAKYCIEQGIPQEDIIKEPHAKNTFENARKALEIMQQHDYTHAKVVTSSFHAARAKYFFAKYIDNIEVIAAPYPKSFPFLKKVIFTIKEQLILILFSFGLLNKRYALR